MCLCVCRVQQIHTLIMIDAYLLEYLERFLVCTLYCAERNIVGWFLYVKLWLIKTYWLNLNALHVGQSTAVAAVEKISIVFYLMEAIRESVPDVFEHCIDLLYCLLPSSLCISRSSERGKTLLSQFNFHTSRRRRISCGERIWFLVILTWKACRHTFQPITIVRWSEKWKNKIRDPISEDVNTETTHTESEREATAVRSATNTPTDHKIIRTTSRCRPLKSRIVYSIIILSFLFIESPIHSMRRLYSRRIFFFS